MTRRVRILVEAADEAIAAAAWYEAQQQGLGKDFQAALDAALDFLAAEIVPLSVMQKAAGGRGAKRVLLRRFPYSVVVIEMPGEYVVVAIAHQSRRPAYWRNRKRD